MSFSIQNSLGREILISFLKDRFGDNTTIDKFDALTELYNEVNSCINISAIRQIDDIYIKHYLDSIYPYEYFSGTCCDVGCGGGFPSLPLSIVTGKHFDAVESVGKKLTLIKRANSELKLSNIFPIHSRAEELISRGNSYDTVTARAVADLGKTLKYCAPLTKQGGKIVLFKTQNDEQVNNEILVRFEIKTQNAFDYTLPGTDIKRRLFVFIKS